MTYIYIRSTTPRHLIEKFSKITKFPYSPYTPVNLCYIDVFSTLELAISSTNQLHKTCENNWNLQGTIYRTSYYNEFQHKIFDVEIHTQMIDMPHNL